MKFDRNSFHNLLTEWWDRKEGRQWRLGFVVKNRATAIAMMDDRETWDFLVKRHSELELDD